MMLENLGHSNTQNNVNIRNDYQVECIYGAMNAPSKMVNSMKRASASWKIYHFAWCIHSTVNALNLIIIPYIYIILRVWMTKIFKHHMRISFLLIAKRKNIRSYNWYSEQPCRSEAPPTIWRTISDIKTKVEAAVSYCNYRPKRFVLKNTNSTRFCKNID